MMYSWLLLVLSLRILVHVLPLGGGMPSPFTNVPPSVLYVVSGKDARMEWNYSVSDKNTEFSSYSPTWYYMNTSKIQLAYEYKWSNPKWQWSVASTCPERLKGRIFKESTATLVILNVTAADNGLFECELSLKGGETRSSKAKLFVTVSPRFLINPLSSIVVSESSNLTMSCSASGSPTPNITWVRLQDNSILIERKGSATLVIRGIRRDQNGTYECRASNNPNEVPVYARTMVVVQYFPIITTAPKATEVTQGNQFFLTCRASGNPVPTISWSKDGGNIKAGSSTSGNTLVIPDAAKSDAGNYICRASNVFDTKKHIATASAYVTVKYQPTMLSNSKHQIINETNPLRLTCVADGYPAPNISWTKSPGTMTPVSTGNKYSIPSARRSDAGTYTCTASNGIGKKAVTNIQVTVQYKAEIDASNSTKTLDSWKGKHIRLQCSFIGNPAPRISWYKPSGSKVTSPYERTSNGSTFLSELNITTTSPEDYGKYKCLAANVVGTDEHYVVVKQLFTPYQPEQSHMISDSKGTQVTIFWCAPGVKGGTPVIDYKVEINSNPPRKMITKYTFAEIKDLKENTKYTVKVYARNKAGYGDPVNRDIVTGNPENHSTFVVASLSTILAISLLTNAIFVFTIIKAEREEKEGKHRLHKRPKNISYENKADVEMEDIAGDERDHPMETNTGDPGIQVGTSSRAVEGNASHYQSLSSATRCPVETRPPQLYEPLIATTDIPQRSEYASLQINSRSTPKVVEEKHSPGTKDPESVAL